MKYFPFECPQLQLTTNGVCIPLIGRNVVIYRHVQLNIIRSTGHMSFGWVFTLSNSV